MSEAELERNLTPEVKDFMAGRMMRLTDAARTWPVKVAISATTALAEVHAIGTRQIHLVCWLETTEPKNGLPVHCGQSVSVLARGRNLYRTTPQEIAQGIMRHISQCHEGIWNG